MARTADHDARRLQVAEAVARLIADGGFDQVSVARTAAEAGMSVGLVQHYFRTKDEMLLHTFTHVTGRMLARVESRIAEFEARRGRIQQALLAGLAESLPLDDARRAEWPVTAAFTARALDNPRLAAVRTDVDQRLRHRIAQAVHNGKECGEVPAARDPEPAAVGILALTCGLGGHAFTEPAVVTPGLALRILDDHLATVFPGRCRQYG